MDPCEGLVEKPSFGNGPAMTADRHARVKQLFLEAIELPTSDRGPWLENACAQDPSLRAEVDALLVQQTAESSRQAPSAMKPPDNRWSDVAQDERPPGTIIAGRYRIVSPLGVGGMGIVYRAEDLTLNQPVAIKFLPPAVATNPAWLARFRNEARLARTVTHPNVCRVHDIGEADGENFITMEFVSGEDLASLLRQIGRPSNDKSLNIAKQICAGLATAHRAGVLHRDLKPANIMIDADGNARITDFGIAGLSGHIAAGEIRAGTPAYMAPEQITGRDVTVRSDIYALGLVLYELFSGCQAFRAETIGEYLRLHENQTPRPLSEIVEHLPQGVEDVVQQCLQKQPELRPASALHVAAALPGTDALQVALESGITPSPDLIAASPARKNGASHRAWLMVAGLSLLACVAILRSVYPIQWDNLGTLPPAALAERARRSLETAGFSRPLAHEAFGYCATEDAWQPMALAFAGEDIATRVLPARAAEPCFFYHQSDRPLVPVAMENVFWRAGYVTPWDPPIAKANSRAVLLNSGGDLILLGAGPDDAAGESKAGDGDRVNEVWSALKRAAGMDIDRPDTVESPAIDFQGCKISELSNTRTLNGRASVMAGCTSHGSPTFFAAGTQPKEDSPVRGGEKIVGASQRSIVITAQRMLFLLLFVITVPIGLRKLCTARIDYHGVVQIAIVIVLLEIAAAVLHLERSVSFYDGLSRLCMAVVRGAGIAGLFGIFYLAVDAYARRFWPHLLVTWNRLLLHRFGDPDVRFHTLIGACVGCWWAFVTAAERAIVSITGQDVRPMFSGERVAEKLHGVTAALASYLGCVEQSLIYGLLFLLLLVVVRTWIRHPAWAAVVCALLMAPVVVPRGANSYTAWLAMGLCGVVVCVWIMVRYGLLAMVVAIFVSAVLNATPMNVSSHAWTAGISMCAIIIVVCFIAYGAVWRPAGFRTSSAPLSGTG